MATKVNSSVATAMAIAGRASRACDVCGSKSARWYCAADEAYLCEGCDNQVHSANSLALRHERVRLAPNGAPGKGHRKNTSSSTEVVKKIREESPSSLEFSTKQLHSPVLPCRKRSRTGRPHPHHIRNSSSNGPHYKCSKPNKSEDLKVKVESPSCDFLDTDEVITDGTHEVPAFITVIQDSSSGSDLSLDCHIGFQEEHAAPSDSFTACFKGKAAQAQAHGDLSDNTDQFLVPDTLDNCLDSGDDLCCNMDGVVGLVGDPNFPGDIPGLDGFEDFGSRGLTDDCGLSFDLALRGGSEAFDGDGCDTSEAGLSSGDNGVGVESDQFHTGGPFSKFFAGKVKTEKQMNMTPDKIKKEAEEILKCSLEGLSEEDLRLVPSLRLNYEDVLSAWSGRGGPWMDGRRPQLVPDDTNSDATGSMDIGLVPDLGQGAADDGQSGGREARVLRYKEKRRTRLFSKKIRYEVRKLNAERRPRMKVFCQDAESSVNLNRSPQTQMGSRSSLSLLCIMDGL